MPALQGAYINLAASTGRRDAMEAQLQRLGLGWVRRFEAVPARPAGEAGDAVAAAERACVESHARLAGHLAASPGFSLVLEDDALLSDALPAVLAQPGLLAQLAPYDLAFLECQPDIGTPALMALWASRQRRMSPLGGTPRRLLGVDILEAQGVYRWGAVAYLLTPRGAPVLQALAARALAEGPGAPWDLMLRRWIEGGQLRAAVLSPFLATARLDSHGDSTIAGHSRALAPPERLGAAMRRLFFAGPSGELAAFAEPARRAALTDDPELRLLADLVAQLFVVNVQGEAVTPAGPADRRSSAP